MAAPTYAARANYNTAVNGNCPTYPCTLRLFDPWLGDQVGPNPKPLHPAP